MNLSVAREQMINQQLRTWDVLNDTILDTVRAIGREQFVPERYRSVAFGDFEIPLAHGEIMLAPKIEGKLLQALAIRRSDNILQIGTGSGFVAACLGALGSRVVSYEQHSDLAVLAEEKLRSLGRHANVEIVRSAFDDETAAGEYDAIAVCGSVSELTPALTRSLAVGGRLFVVVGNGPIQQAKLITRTGDSEYRQDSLFDTVLPMLSGFLPKPKFHF